MKALSLAIIFFFLGLAGMTQNDDLRFTQKKVVNPDEQVIYFHLTGLKNQTHQQAVLKSLLDDPKIRDGRIFVSGDGRDRCQLYMSRDVDANYVRGILLGENVDYEFTAVARNGEVSIDPENPNRENSYSKNQSNYNPVNKNGFPVMQHTGNPDKDKQEYAQKKKTWIEAHPEEYQEMLDKLQNKKQVISAEEFDKLSKEEQKEILEHPDKYKVE